MAFEGLVAARAWQSASPYSMSSVSATAWLISCIIVPILELSPTVGALKYSSQRYTTNYVK